MNTWRWHGSVMAISAAVDSALLSTGTSRQPSSDLPLVGDHLGDERLHGGALIGVLRHEDVADRVLAGLGQGEAQPLRLAGEELVRDLHQHAGAVAHQRVGADGAAMLEVLEDLQPVLDDAVGLAVVQVDDEADAAGVALVQRVVEAAARSRRRAGERVWPPGEGSHRRSQPLRSVPQSSPCYPRLPRRRAARRPGQPVGLTSAAPHQAFNHRLAACGRPKPVLPSPANRGAGSDPPADVVQSA